MIWGGRWEWGSGLGTHVHPWLIHVNVWQNQYSIVKQNKEKNKNKKVRKRSKLLIKLKKKSLLQHHSSKASIFQRSAFFIVQLSHPYMTTGKTIALTRSIFVGKEMSLLLFFFNFFLKIFIFNLFYFTILYWFCHTSTWIHHRCTWVPNPEPPLPPSSPYHLSGSSPCTSPKHPVSCIEHRLAIRFLQDSIHVSMPFSQIFPPSPSPTMDYYSAIKNTFESVLMRWMKLEPII